jgi:hypothetical protein
MTNAAATQNANLIGRTVNYSGDIANAPRSGYLADIIVDRWGTHAVIAWDSVEAIGWEDGEAVHFQSPTSTISLHQINGKRFAFAD